MGFFAVKYSNTYMVKLQGSSQKKNKRGRWIKAYLGFPDHIKEILPQKGGGGGGSPSFQLWLDP